MSEYQYKRRYPKARTLIKVLRDLSKFYGVPQSRLTMPLALKKTIRLNYIVVQA